METILRTITLPSGLLVRELNSTPIICVGKIHKVLPDETRFNHRFIVTYINGVTIDCCYNDMSDAVEDRNQLLIFCTMNNNDN